LLGVVPFLGELGDDLGDGDGDGDKRFKRGILLGVSIFDTSRGTGDGADKSGMAGDGVGCFNWNCMASRRFLIASVFLLRGLISQLP
jgi:hypothetical protein